MKNNSKICDLHSLYKYSLNKWLTIYRIKDRGIWQGGESFLDKSESAWQQETSPKHRDATSIVVWIECSLKMNSRTLSILQTWGNGGLFSQDRNEFRLDQIKVQILKFFLICPNWKLWKQKWNYIPEASTHRGGNRTHQRITPLKSDTKTSLTFWIFEETFVSYWINWIILIVFEF